MITEILKNASILVVDDQPANVKLLEKSLELDGFLHITATTDPAQAISLFKVHRHDLVLLDLNMPEIDGFMVMAAMKEFIDNQEDFLPVIVLTAQTDRVSRLRALEAGARDYLTKPFDRTELSTRIRNMLEVRVLHNQIRDQNRSLEEKVRERTQELESTRLEIIKRLGRAAEYRDNETGLHIIRMSRIASLLARAAGLDRDQCELVLNASPMHDVGKIGIPDKILLKPGKLDADEWEIMKTHVSIGREILSGHESGLLNLAADIAYTHHEKWDGSGYPQGLKGEEIPLIGRIVALADVFDALTSERPYKKAWTVEDATNFVYRESGHHFDPEIVELFKENIEGILEIRNTYAEPV
ncbi:MAG: response regulator [Gammaproteobacteria bacterium]|nr:response regulator [Gammaproteobacteria bacterium]